MTTIVYNHESKEIAVDSRFTRADVISTDKATKALRKNGVVFVCEGRSARYHMLVDMWFSGEAVKDLECSALVVFAGQVFDYGLDDDGEILSELVDENHAKGSGAQFALSAMDFGKSAKEAVQYAMTRDIYTGGKVKVIKVK